MKTNATRNEESFCDIIVCFGRVMSQPFSFSDATGERESSPFLTGMQSFAFFMGIKSRDPRMSGARPVHFKKTTIC